MTTFGRLAAIVAGVFRVHPSALRESVTLAALTGPRDTGKRIQLAEAVFRSFGVAIENDLHDCVTLGALAEAIDQDIDRDRARAVRNLQAAE